MFWKFILANSKDMTDIGQLVQARSRGVNIVHNLPGSATFKYPMTSEYAELMTTWDRCIKAYRWNWRASRAWQSAGNKGNVWDCQWSGPIANIDEDVTGNSMVVNCVGWHQRWDKRKLRRDKTFPYIAGTQWDDADIIFALLAEVNGIGPGVGFEFAAGVSYVDVPDNNSGTATYRLYWPAGSTPNVPTWIKQGQKLPNEGPGGATAYTPAYRGESYQVDQMVGPAIQDLCNLEGGCDIRVDPLTRELNVYRKCRVIRDDVIFGYKWGPRNIKQFGRQVDGTTQLNYGLARGRGGSVPKYQDDIPAMQQYGPMEEVFNLTDVVDQVQTPTGASQSVLWSYAAGEVALRSQPHQTFSVQPFPYTIEGSVPEPFVDYDVGDQVRLTAKLLPRINIQNLPVRVFGYNVSIDDNGNETLGQLQFSP